MEKEKTPTKTKEKPTKTKAESLKTKTQTKTKSEKKPEKKPSEPKNLKILGYNDLELNTYIFDDVENPKAVVLVVHGMQEHCLRYVDFAKFLNKNGYIVVMSDLRGHGHTAISKERLGYGEKDIFNETLQDQLNILSYINETYNLPIYLFGHSYGSMLGQVLIQRTPLIEKAVLCGTTNGSCGIMKLGSFVISLMSPFKKKDKRGGLIEKMCIKSYGKKFERGNWLTKDEKVFDAYLKDEYCGGLFPFIFFI